MKSFLLGLLATAIVGCASLASPETTNQKIAYVYAGLTAATETTADLLERDRITVPIAKEIDDQIGTGQVLLSNARLAVNLKNMTNANDLVLSAQKILITVETKLKAAK